MTDVMTGCCKACGAKFYESSPGARDEDLCDLCAPVAETAGEAVACWIDGAPSGFRAQEWFIAKTTYGDRVVLRALPDEYAYDFKTADETYIRRDKVAAWMPFSDSEFTPPVPAQDDDKLRRAVEALDAAYRRWVVEAGESNDVLQCVGPVIAAMKSTAAKEGG